MNWIQIVYLVLTSNLTWLTVGAVCGVALNWARKKGRARRKVLVRVISEDGRTETNHWVKPGPHNTVRFEVGEDSEAQLPIVALVGDGETYGARVMYVHADNMRPIDFRIEQDEPQGIDERPGDYLTRTWDGFRLAAFTEMNWKPWEDEAGLDTNLVVVGCAILLAVIIIALHFYGGH